MTVMTRHQCAKLAANLTKSIEDENTRNKNISSEELIGVLRDRWHNCQDTAIVAMNTNRVLEETIVGLKDSLNKYIKNANVDCEHLWVAKNKITDQHYEIMKIEHNYQNLEIRYNDLYETYQEMSIAAGSQIASIEKTCKNQAEAIDSLETEIKKLKNVDDSYQVQSDVMRIICKTFTENIGPIRELVDSTKIDAVSSMRKALLNIIGVQYKSFEHFTKYELNEAIKESGQNIETRDAPYEFICPISGDIMESPVITSNGEIYDNKSIDAWKNELADNKRNVKGYEYCDDRGGNMESPLSRSWISGVFYPLVGLRTQIIEWREKRHHANRALLGMTLYNLKYASNEAKKIIGPNSENVIKSNETIALNDKCSSMYILRDMRETILDNHCR